MAYADKITQMRRMALISSDPENSGVIQWEGVEIEGTCLLKEVDSDGSTVTVIEDENLEQWLFQHDLQAVYQDPEDQDYWEPREQLKARG